MTNENDQNTSRKQHRYRCFMPLHCTSFGVHVLILFFFYINHRSASVHFAIAFTLLGIRKQKKKRELLIKSYLMWPSSLMQSAKYNNNINKIFRKGNKLRKCQHLKLHSCYITRNSCTVN